MGYNSILMTTSITKRYSFGEDNKFFYEFKVHIYVGESQTITTIMLNSTNMRQPQLDLVRQNIPGLVTFLSELCVEYNAHYDGYHNFLTPLSFKESDEVVDLVNAAIQSIKNPSV